MGDFKEFSTAVAVQFDKMSNGRLFKLNIDTDLLYQTYLDAYPEGTNPLFRERTEHDCSCCRNFIKNVGPVVTIQDNKIVTVWDNPCDEFPYNIVGKALSDFVTKHAIKDVFLTKEGKYGNEFNLELLDDKTTRKWHHFVGVIKPAHKSENPAEDIGVFRTDFQVLKRSLEEITPDALETVVDLIQSGSLYRGDEHLSLVRNFKELHRDYSAFPHNNKDLFIWQHIGKGSLSRFRNTVIGTLVSDLSEDTPLEDAVKMFESKVAPDNYKRPKALITPKMVSQAMKTIKELGLEPALERRHAMFSDVSVNDVLFVDNSVKTQLVGGLEEKLLGAAKTQPVKVRNAIDVKIDDFVSAVLPRAQGIEVLFKNKHLPNLMSITAPASPDVNPLFKWDNNFAWSYSGNTADSDIKKRVAAAGGNVDALFRVSLGWQNYDDLDIHVKTPNGRHIYFGNKSGILDVDMNAGSRRSLKPVENTCWDKKNLKDGVYTFSVHNYSQRATTDVGFTLEVVFGGHVQTFQHVKGVPNDTTVRCLEVVIKNGIMVSVSPLTDSLTSESSPQDAWGIKTETFIPVSSVVLSPNHWGTNKVGNKHWFFLLKGCLNPDPVRGIYNEFLSQKLSEHRKVFEVVGDKTKCVLSSQQLSGIGFSSTKREELKVRVKSDKTQQIYNIQF